MYFKRPIVLTLPMDLESVEDVTNRYLSMRNVIRPSTALLMRPRNRMAAPSNAMMDK